MIAFRRSRRVVSTPHRGQSLVVVALALFVLMGSMGLALDGGYNYSQRRQMQNAADAAALAGARLISTGNSTGANLAVLTTVRAVAAQNGMPDTSVLQCTLYNDSWTNLGACFDTTALNPLPTGATIVEVTTLETHATFAMPVLGVTRSGTRANAASQIQILRYFSDAPFIVCGIDTKVDLPARSAFTGGIFKVDDANPYSLPRGGGYEDCRVGGGGLSACKRTKEITIPGQQTAPEYNSGIWYYDWDATNPLAQPIQYAPATGTGTVNGPEFVIHDPNVAPCNSTSSSFKGINENTTAMELLEDPYPPLFNDPYNGPDQFQATIKTGTTASVRSNVGGASGCTKGMATITNCVLILPIVDNSGPGGSGTNVIFGLRTFAAFYVIEKDSNTHIGRMIKNYKIQGNGSGGFVPDMDSPVIIRLVK